MSCNDLSLWHLHLVHSCDFVSFCSLHAFLNALCAHTCLHMWMPEPLELELEWTAWTACVSFCSLIISFLQGLCQLAESRAFAFPASNGPASARNLPVLFSVPLRVFDPCRSCASNNGVSSIAVS